MYASHRFWHGFEDLELLLSSLLDLHDCGQVVAAIAIVRCAPDSHQIFVLNRLSSYLEPVDVSLLDQLMSTGNQVKSVDMAEVIGDLRSEDPTSSSGIDGPIFNVLRVGPHEIAERTLMRNLNLPINGSNLINGLYFRAESTMNTKHLSWVNQTLPSMTAPIGR